VFINSYKLNGIAGHMTRQAICKGLNINFTDIYKIVKSVNNDGIIETTDGKKYQLTLKKLEI